MLLKNSVDVTSQYAEGDFAWTLKYYNTGGMFTQWNATHNGMKQVYLNSRGIENQKVTLTCTFSDMRESEELFGLPPMEIEYTYNVTGLRVQKKVISSELGFTIHEDPVNIPTVTTTNYTLHGKLLTHLTQGTDALHFYYDAQSKPIMMRWGMTEETAKYYTFVSNLQGDILGILDKNQDLVVEYRYDPWGKLLNIICEPEYADLAKLNPFRYRGYVYDEDTGLYYLRSRYYNPEWGRFVNEDSLVGKVGKPLNHNMFTYCRNNPVVMLDTDGAEPVDAIERSSFGGGRTGGGTTRGGGTGRYPIMSFSTTESAIISDEAMFQQDTSIDESVIQDESVGGDSRSQNWRAEATAASIIAGAVLVTYVAATFSTKLTGIISENRIELDKIGKLEPNNHPGEGYYGVRYRVYKPGKKDFSLRSIEFHTHPHKGYNPHWQLNYWNLRTGIVNAGKAYWTW